MQLPLFPDQPDRPVNVASVKHRSPFRYPGGKTWLVPRIRLWLTQFDACPALFVEPFAGGAIVGLTVAFEGLAEHVILVERDEDVAAVWTTIINAGEGAWLADRIEDFVLTTDAIEQLLAAETTSTRERAFQTLVRNRVNRGGILAPGAGRLKTGENGKGLASRWYPQTLARRIRDIDRIRDRLSFVAGDGMVVIEQHLHDADSVFFLDPPYTAAGKRAGRRLYRHADIDHERLFGLTNRLRGNFLMTYDNNAAVRQMADSYGFAMRPVAMKSTHHAEMTELLIARQLDWMPGVLSS